MFEGNINYVSLGMEYGVFSVFNGYICSYIYGFMVCLKLYMLFILNNILYVWI